MFLLSQLGGLPAPPKIVLTCVGNAFANLEISHRTITVKMGLALPQISAASVSQAGHFGMGMSDRGVAFLSTSHHRWGELERVFLANPLVFSVTDIDLQHLVFQCPTPFIHLRQGVEPTEQKMLLPERSKLFQACRRGEVSPALFLHHLVVLQMISCWWMAQI